MAKNRKPASFVHLRVKSAYSLLEGAVRPKEMADLARLHAMPAVAVTDANNLFGAYEISETLAKGRFRSPEKVSEYATLLLNDVSRLTRTVDNLLTVSRVQDIERFYTFESVDPGTLLEDALNSFDAYLKEQGFEVHVDIPAPLPAVMADRIAIGQVLENILDNAIRYSNGTRHLTISASATDTQVTMRIADKGQGIPPDEVLHVFEKFYRGHGVSPGGSGLGLSIAQRIMKDHHGEVRLASVQGSGTVAEILLPMSGANASAIARSNQ